MPTRRAGMLADEVNSGEFLLEGLQSSAVQSSPSLALRQHLLQSPALLSSFLTLGPAWGGGVQP